MIKEREYTSRVKNNHGEITAFPKCVYGNVLFRLF